MERNIYLLGINNSLSKDFILDKIDKILFADEKMVKSGGIMIHFDTDSLNETRNYQIVYEDKIKGFSKKGLIYSEFFMNGKNAQNLDRVKMKFANCPKEISDIFEEEFFDLAKESHKKGNRKIVFNVD